MTTTHIPGRAQALTHSALQRSQLEAKIFAWLEDVSDPEIPVISVVDLGIVRAVRLGAASAAAGVAAGVADEVTDWEADGAADVRVDVLGSATDEDVLQSVHCTVVITPTYSGCPAMKVIAADIVAALSEHGVSNVTIETALSPAWSTDWMSEKGRRQLKDYHIAPPAQQVINISGISRNKIIAPEVVCPHCGSASTLCVSEFGSTSCKSLFKCKDCLEPFDYFKAH